MSTSSCTTARERRLKFPPRRPKSSWVKLTAATAVVLAALAAAPAAPPNTSTSANWAGFAVHKPGVNFHKVTGTWVQPTASCTPGSQSYSAFWVGIGGYYLNSSALEQVGTEID